MLIKRHSTSRRAIQYRYANVWTCLRDVLVHTHTLALAIWMTNWIENAIRELSANYSSTFTEWKRKLEYVKKNAYTQNRLFVDFRYVHFFPIFVVVLLLCFGFSLFVFSHRVVFSLVFYLSFSSVYWLFTVPYGIPTSNCMVLWFFLRFVFFCHFVSSFLLSTRMQPLRIRKTKRTKKNNSTIIRAEQNKTKEEKYRTK